MARKIKSAAKEAKKQAKEPKTELTEFEKKLLASEPKKITYMLQNGDTSDIVKVSVLQTLPMQIYTDIRSILPDMFFPNGCYDPFFGRTALSMILFSAYTGLTFGDDMDAFNRFCAEYHWYDTGVEMPVSSIFPSEAKHFVEACYDAVKELCRMYHAPIEETEMHEKITKLASSVNNVLDAIEQAIDAFAKRDDVNDVKLADLINAVNNVGVRDDKKIAEAVLDFQREKAKRDRKAEGSPSKE